MEDWSVTQAVIRVICELGIRMISYYQGRHVTGRRSAYGGPVDVRPKGSLVRLRRVLSEIYPCERSARRICDEAGLRVELLYFRGPAADMWHDLVTEAGKHSYGITLLLRVALEEYPSNHELASLAAEFGIS
jgi:hypothetical protein